MSSQDCFELWAIKKYVDVTGLLKRRADVNSPVGCLAWSINKWTHQWTSEGEYQRRLAHVIAGWKNNRPPTVFSLWSSAGVPPAIVWQRTLAVPRWTTSAGTESTRQRSRPLEILDVAVISSQSDSCSSVCEWPRRQWTRLLDDGKWPCLSF